MNWIIFSSWKQRNNLIVRCLLLLFLVCCQTVLFAQFNFVPNPGFEEISNCDLEYGETYKAPPWEIINLPIATPDLFHACSTNPFFELSGQVGCTGTILPSGDGMVGMVTMASFVEERIYARLLGDLPLNIDLYVAYSIIPRERCGSPTELLCYSNTHSMVFADIQLESKTTALALDTILSYTGEWTKLEGCYQANGSEKMILLGNFTLTSETLKDCDNFDPEFNFSYFFIDDVIVAPFDVVPDTFFICGDEVLDVDATFYDVPIFWSDGVTGAMRTIGEGGLYTVMGDVGDCSLMDETVVIKIPDEMESITVDICEDEVVSLTTPVLAEWSNGEKSKRIEVTLPGTYTANLITSCGERITEFTVEETDCAIQYFVPNIFSPNDDGINDQLEFFFKSEFEFIGELNVFDRWGNHLFHAKEVGTFNSVRWDGTHKNEKMNTGVFIWMFTYVSAKDGETRTVSGDVTLVR